MSTTLAVRRLSKSFRNGVHRNVVIEDITVDIAAHEFVSVVGPSGIGKTTLLRCLSGLIPTTQGSISIHGRAITEPPPEIAMVFQDYSRSLMPWMSVEKNVLLPLRAKGIPRAEAREQARHALGSVGLPTAMSKYPWQLSGGMQQRVAIARALAYKPQIMLMDEPFASVDAKPVSNSRTSPLAQTLQRKHISAEPESSRSCISSL